MAKVKFPNLLHVTREKPSNEESYLLTHESGVLDTHFDETMDCAVYKLISVGRVEVLRRFVQSKRTKPWRTPDVR